MEPTSEPQRIDRPAPDRDGGTLLSSRLRAASAPVLLLMSVAAAAATMTMQQPGPPAALAQSAADRAGSGITAHQATPSPRSDPLWPAIEQWNRLRQSDRLPFDDYAAFLIAHHGWPGELGLRRAAERAILPDRADPARVAAFFAAYPPLTQPGRVRYAEALATLGKAAEARDAAAAAWTGGALSPDDEGRLTTRFASQFSLAEQDRRMDRLLWDHATSSASRQLALVSPGRRPLFAARLAFQTHAPDAAMLATAAGDDAAQDAGYVIDRANWLRDTAQAAAARAWLAQPRQFAVPPLDAARYLQTLLTIAKEAAHDGQASLAYQIAAGADAAFPAGTDLSDRPLSERDPYTSLVWLGGQMALKKLGRPHDAETMFARYASASRTPGSQAKGDYWAGRAAQAAGDPGAAKAHYASAAQNVDQFYGQLASERLGRPITVPADPPRLAVDEATRAAFEQSEPVRPARLLGEAHDWQDQTQFVRQIALDARSDSDHALADELARTLGRPDLGVILSREARLSGARDPLRIGFPEIAVPPAMESQWTMIHAITRQESQFDREATSPVGAHGLMQLMNATAREQAAKLGLPWDPSRLVDDPQYNVAIGSSFFDRMLTYYDGNYVLAIASYNAGPGNVNRFIRDNGDPRTGNVDIVDWIEAIPLAETRAYVQHVLENAVVYDLFNPERAHTPEHDRLSWYLGKKTGG